MSDSILTVCSGVLGESPDERDGTTRLHNPTHTQSEPQKKRNRFVGQNVHSDDIGVYISIIVLMPSLYLILYPDHGLQEHPFTETRFLSKVFEGVSCFKIASAIEDS